MRIVTILSSLALVVAFAPLGASHGSCTHTPVHTYFSGGQLSASSQAVQFSSGSVTVYETNTNDCDGDGVFFEFDGDFDLGTGGGFFGYGPFAASCGLDAFGGNYIVSDITGLPVTFWVGADDQAGGLLPCVTDGVIDSSNPNDCLHGPYATTGVASPCTGGGDGGVWIIFNGLEGHLDTLSLSNTPTAGTIYAY